MYCLEDARAMKQKRKLLDILDFVIIPQILRYAYFI